MLCRVPDLLSFIRAMVSDDFKFPPVRIQFEILPAERPQGVLYHAEGVPEELWNHGESIQMEECLLRHSHCH